MATVVLTAVGALVGGPVGAAVGAVVGQAVDARIFGPKARHGPRLGDLAVQTSSYGTPVPKLFGTMRAAGTVIWATDLRETRSSSGGEKGRPKSVSYSYSASFAVALSARPIQGVGRIWADGKLLRGAGGDFKTETKFRLHLGSEGQAADPMIAAAEGAEGTPAYRGLAYAVFEDMELAEYGNRIPSLSFEIEADEGPVSIGSIAEQLSGGVLVAGNSPDLIGYAAGGDSVRSAIESLSAFVPLSLVAQGDRLLITRPAGPEASLDPAESGARPGSEGGTRDEQARQAAATVPNSVTIAFADPARDFQAGLQRAFRGGAALIAEQHALPAAVTAIQAKALAEARLAGLWAGRTSASLHLPSRAANVRPGELVRIEGQPGLWRIERWMLEAMVVKLQLVRVPASAAAPMDASSGRPLGERDLRHGPTILRLIELPSDGETASDRPRLLIAAAGELPGWRRAALMLSLDRGASWQELGGTAAPAVIGKTQTALPPAGSALLDGRHAIIVQLGHDEMWLQSATDPALANGANLALIGDELIQFGAAEPIGDNRFRLSRLLRGRLGTEWAALAHQPDDDFVLLDSASLLPVEVPVTAVGGEMRVSATGLGDALEGVGASRPVSGEALRPPSPVHLRASTTSGGVEIGWTRRSRTGWAWTDGADASVAEEAERYELVISGAAFRRAIAVATPGYLYSLAEQAADAASGPVVIEVVQLGTRARSRPARMLWTI